ncbi:recombinase family protein [Microbacterium lacticum]
MTTPTTTAKRAVLYVRISDDPEGLEKGVDRQEADCRAFAESHGYVVERVFRENDTSAFKQRTITLPSGEKVRRVVRPGFCQWPIGTARGRPAEMPAGGHGNCPLMANRSAHQGVGGVGHVEGVVV